jgi:hypothetical protein
MNREEAGGVSDRNRRQLIIMMWGHYCPRNKISSSLVCSIFCLYIPCNLYFSRNYWVLKALLLDKNKGKGRNEANVEQVKQLKCVNQAKMNFQPKTTVLFFF